MNDQNNLNQFYDTILGLPSAWKTVEVIKDDIKKEITVKVEYASELCCPVCMAQAKLHDHRIRKLRHLDTCNYKTLVEVKVPRVRCLQDNVQQLPLEFAEKHSMYTALFEMQIIEWLKDMTIKSVAHKMKLSWDAIDGIMQRGVKRGLARREKAIPQHIGIDETSYQKRHDYVTTIINKDNGTVLDVLDGRDAETVKKWLKEQKTADFSTVQSISMDMSGSFIKAMRDSFENAKDIICFDRFHVSQLFNKALDKVRRVEHMELTSVSEKNPLVKSRWDWLINSDRTDNRTGKRKNFLSITKMHLKTARAWKIKETASTLWDFAYLGAAERNWKSLLWWISHCRIKEMIKVGRTIKEHLWGILNAVKMKINNAMLESKNNIIQHIKRMACGFRNKSRFRTAIMFHLGGLNMAIGSP